MALARLNGSIESKNLVFMICPLFDSGWNP